MQKLQEQQTRQVFAGYLGVGIRRRSLLAMALPLFGDAFSSKGNAMVQWQSEISLSLQGTKVAQNKSAWRAQTCSTRT